MPSGAPVRARLRLGLPWGCRGGLVGLVSAQSRDPHAAYITRAEQSSFSTALNPPRPLPPCCLGVVVSLCKGYDPRLRATSRFEAMAMACDDK